MSLSLIVAVAKNGVIGRENALPWHLPEDLRRFKSLTLGHHLIMGRKTFESLGRVLPGRTSLIVTRDPSWSFPGAVVVHSLAAAVDAAAGDCEAFVIGGATLFQEAAPLATRTYLTRVLVDVPGDTYLDLGFLEGGWRMDEQSPVRVSRDGGIPYRFENYSRNESPLVDPPA